MQSPGNFDFVIQSVFESLEERVLFDGVPDAAFIVHENVAGQPVAQFQQQQQVDSQTPIELIIIDAGVQDRDRLVSEIIENKSGRTFEIQLLSSAEDGVSQITDILAQSETRYDAIHILSHGDDGEIQLGNSSLSNDSFSRYVDQLTQWSDVLTDDADLLLYGCNLAEHETGLQLLDSISAVTGADVAASDDLTGSDQVGGDWHLEIETGEIESRTLDAGGWLGVLAIEATDGIVTIQDAENSAAGTITITNDGAPETVTVLNTPTRVGQMLERVYTFNETADTGRATYVFDVSGIAGINATIASEFGLIISDQPDLADGPNTTTLVASGYDAANGLVFFHQVDLNSGDFFGLATEVVQDNFSINPTAIGPEDTAIDLGLTLSPSLTQGGQLQDIIATDAGFRDSTAGAATTDYFIPAGTTGIRITGFSTRDIGTAANDALNDDYQFLNVSIDLESETSNGYIGHIIDQGPNRSDQFGWEEAPLGAAVLTGGGTIIGDANDNINPTFTIVDGVLQIAENHQLQTAYHVEYLTNATSSSEFIRTESAVLESNDQSNATLSIPANADFLVVNITDAAAGASSAIEYKGNSRVYIDLATLQASGVVAAQQGETDVRVVNYGFEDYDVSSAAVGSILSAAGTIVGDTTGLATVTNDNQIYIDAAGNLVIDRDNSFATSFNSLVTVEYYERRDVGSSAEQLGVATDYGFWDADPSNPTSTLEFDIPDNAALGILNLTQNGTRNSDTNENSGAAFAVIDLVNGTSSGSLYFVRASSVVDLVGWDATAFGTAFFDDPNSISNHSSLPPFNDEFGGTATFNLINGGTTLELAVSSGDGTQTFRDYYAGGQVEWFGAAPFEVSGSVANGTFSQGTLNPVTGNFELTIAQAANGLAYIPPTHVSGNVPIDVSLRIGDETEVTSVTIQAVIDPIDFSMAPDACGHEDTDISISANLTPVFIDQDGSETLTSQVLSNIPIGHTLTDGTNVFVSSAGNQSIDVTAWNTNTITYRANPNESGTFTITMDVDWQDVGGGVTDTATDTVTFDVVVKPLNDPPVAVDDFYTVLGNSTLTVNPAAGVINNDSDVDGGLLTSTVVSGPSNGTLTLNPDGSFTYTPTVGFVGTDSFDYEISDGNGGTAIATAFIDVSEAVTGPLDAIDDMVTTNEETLINIDVMNNDNLPFTGAFNIQSTTPPSNGSITVLPDGTIDYTPAPNFFGTDTFTYTLSDASGRTSTATVTVTVLNTQDPPIANADSGSTPEDTTLPNINILANDSDPDNDVLTVTMAVAGNGTVVINPDGTIDYTPNPGFNGTDTVNYTISDGNGGFATSTVLINVVPVADPPTSVDNTVKTDEEVPYVFQVSDFAFADQDPFDSLVAVRVDTLPADGLLLLNGNPVTASTVISLSDVSNGNLIFVPDQDGFGTNYTSFDFSVGDGLLFQTSPNTMTIDVCPVQDPPVATDNAITVAEDSTSNPLGLAPPTDVDGDALTAIVTGLPTQGMVFLADGVTPVNIGDMLTVAQLTTLVYDAPATFTVPSAGSFTYDVTDGIATDSGQVDITITPVNDPPLVDLNGGPAGEDYADTFTEGGATVGIADPTVTVTDEDDIRLALLKIDVDQTTIVDAGEEFLVIGGVDFQLDVAANSTTAVTIGTTSYDVMFDAATARFDIVRTDGIEMTLAQSQVVLASITYRNDSVLPTVGDRDFDVCVNDGDTDSNIATSTISVARDAETAVWSVTGPATVIDGNNATFVVELSDPLRDGETALVDIGLMDIDTNAADLGAFNTAINAAVAAYTGPGSLTWNGTTLTFTSDGTGAMTPLSIVVPTTPDGAFEGDEDFKISLTNPASSTGETISIDPAADEVITTIIDNTVAPTLMIGDGMAVEGSPVVFNLTLDVPSFEPITFDLAAATGSATAGADFETTNFEFFDGTTWQPAVAGTQVTIVAGQTSLMVRVDTVQEGLVEQDETFTLSATAISGTVTGSSDIGTGTIINDDVPQISVDDVTVDEDNGTLTFTVSLDQAPVDPLTVDFATASGTATSGVDFTAFTGTLNFAPGVQTQTVTIVITDDNIFEGPHSFDLNLSNPTNGTILDGTGVGTIIDDGTGPNGSDDDRPVISIDDVTATEDVDMFAVFTVSLSNPSIENVVLTPTLIGGSAVAGTDFGPGLEFFDSAAWQPVTGNITIAAGNTSILIRTAIIDDPIADSGETYTVMVAHVSGTTANTGDTGTGTILDEAIPDPTLVSITGPPSVNEGNAAVYTVEIDNAPLTDVTVTFTYTGTASGGTDYTGVASVTIPAGSTTATVTIPTIDDTLGEPLENFTIAINSVTGGSLEAIQIDPTDFEVTTDIIDDDVPKISVTDVVVTEGFDPFAVFTIELSNPTFEAIDFGLTASGVTANGDTVDFGILGLNELEVFDGTNYVPATAASFAPGDTTIQLRTPIVDDALAEVLETFTVTATVTGGTTCNASASGTGTILDDTTDPEVVLVSLTGPPSVVEGATTSVYTLTLTDPGGLPINAAEDITVTLAYTGAAADGSDFTGVATVVIPAGNGSGTFTLPTVNDSLFEGSEDIIITIDEVTGGGFEGIAADPMADTVTTLIIDDADIPTVAVNNVTSIEGADSFAVFTIELSNLSVEDVNVNLALAGGTAAGGGVDFGAAGAGNLQVFNGTAWVDATTATIAAGDQFVQVRTPIVDDPIDELTENYTLTVDVTAGTTTNIQVVGNGTILDDDPAPGVTIDDATATEGDQLVFNVTLSNPSSQPIVLALSAADNTTSGAADFAQAFEFSTDGGVTWMAAVGGNEVTIPANSGGVLVRTLTTEDATLETTETMELSIANVVSGAVGNTTDTATGTIIDDDTALVSIVANDPLAGEPNNDAQFTITMTNPSDSPTVIAYTVTGTASSGIDFSALPGTITLPAGSTSGTIDLSAIDDLIIEGNENVTITLTSIVSGDADISIDAANDFDTATITDNDNAQWQLTGVTSVNEGAIATYQVELNGTLQAGEAASVELSIGDNSTTSADYASFNAAVATAVAAYAGPGSVVWDGTTLTFTSDGTGEMAPLAIDLMAVNDVIVEGVDDYTVSIASAASTTGIAVGIDATNNSVTTEIQDTIDAAGTSLDKASFSIAGAPSVNESQTTDYTITIDATLQVGEIATVDIQLTGVDTTSGDVTALNAAVTAAVATYNSSGQPGSVAWNGTTLEFTSDGTGPMGNLVVRIQATADGFLEGPEDYTLSLANPASTTGAAVCIDAAMDSVTTTIQPDTTAAWWSIGVDNGGDESATVQYTVSLTESFGAGESAMVDLAVNDVDTNSSDYSNFVLAVNNAVAGYTGPGTLAFDGTTLTFTSVVDGDAMTDLVIDLILINDALAEGTEAFTVDLTGATGPTGVNVDIDTTADSVTTTINDTMGLSGAPDEVVFSIMGPASGPEGTSVQYMLGLSGALGAGESVSVSISLNDIDTTSSDYASFTAAVTAAAAADPNVTFNAATGELTYTAPADGATLTPLLIDLGLSTDAIVEGDEDFEIELSGATSTTGVAVSIDPAKELVTTTISDATAPLEWRIVGPAFEDEGGTAQYLIVLDGTLGAGETATVQIDLNDITTNSNDYAAVQAAITAAVAADPNVAFDSVTGVLTYTSPSDGATMAPTVVDLGITNDVIIEGPEQFEIVLSSPGSTTGAAVQLSATMGSVTTTINDTQGLGGDPDGPAEWSITGNTSVVEGVTASYTIGLTGAFGGGESVSVDLGLSDVDTTSADYANFVAAVNVAVAGYTGSGTVTFDGTTLTFEAGADGDSMDDLIVVLPTIDDTLIEGDEGYTIALTGAMTTTGANVAIDAAAQSVTTTIIDNDTSTWSITGDPTVGEGATAQYTIELAGTLQAGETATIDLGIADVDTTSADYANFVAAVNAAIVGRTDLAFDGTTLTYTGDGNPMTDLIIDLDAIDDVLVEGAEDYNVSISNPGSTTGGSIAVGTNTVNTIISDNDLATWSLTGDTSVAEGGSAQYTIALDATLQLGETATIDIGLTDVDTTSTDYTNFVAAVNAAIAGRPELTFDGTTLTFTSDGNPLADIVISLPTVDDTLSEGTESYNVDIANPGSTTGSTVTGAGLVNTMIIDNDGLLWSISGTTSVDEGDAALYLVSLDGDLQTGEQATVRLTLADLETNSADYSNFITAVQTAVAARPDLVFDAATGLLTVTGTGGPMADLPINLTAIDDAFIEGPERYQVILSDASSATGLDTGIDPTESLVTTTINDTVGVGGVVEKGEWSLGIDQTVPEGTPGAYTLSLAGNFQTGEVVTVEVALTDIDTVAADYASFNAAVNAAVAAYTGPGNVAWDGTTLTFTSDGSGPMSPLAISLGTINDGFSEGQEDFLITLSNANSMTGSAVCIDATADDAVTTIDDAIGGGADDVTFSLIGDVSVDEGGTAGYLIGLTGGLGAGEDASVDLALTDIDTNSSDYANFDAAVMAAVATYNSGGNPGSLSWDGTTLTFTAAADGDVFGGIVVDLMAQDDTFLEGPELYQVALSNSGSSTGVVAGIDAAANIVVTTINDTQGDGGPAEAGGEWSIVGTPAVNEGDPIGYSVGLTGNLQAGENTSVQLTPSDIETNSSDYANFNAAVNSAVAAYNSNAANTGLLAWDGMFLTFTSDGTGPMNNLDVTLNTVDDVIVEGDERLNVILSNPSSSTGLSPTISATQNVVTTTIIDNDSGEWSITGDTSVGEGAIAQYTVALTGTLQAGETATVDLGLANVDTKSVDYANFEAAVNAAIAGRPDLAFDGTTLTYTGDGNPMADLLIDLTAIDDVLIEGDEDFTVSIVNPGSTTGSDVGVGGSVSVTTTITDNDTAIWSISGDATVGEGATAQYTVELNGTLQAGETATIDLGLANVDTASADYANFVAAVNAAIAGRTDLAFDGMTLTYTGNGIPMADLIIDLAAIDDALIEGDEDYTVSIANAGSTTGSAVVTGGTTAVTTTITDNDTATWSITGDSTVVEGLLAQYTVELDGTLQAGETATIDLGIVDVDTTSADYANFVGAVNAAIAARTDLAFDGTTLTYTGDGNPMADLIIDLVAIDDAIIEGDEDYTISIANPGSTTGGDVATGGTTSVTTTITDNDTAIWNITGDSTVGEGATAQYTVELTGILQAGETATIDLGFGDVGTNSADHANFEAAVNAAIAGRTDLAFDGTTLTYTGDGNPMADLIIDLATIDDVLVEGAEDYNVSISNPGSTTGGSIAVGTNTVNTIINDNDLATWSLAGDTSVAEGDTAQYTVALDGILQVGETATIDLGLTDVDTSSADYANFVAAVNTAIAGRPELAFDGTTLTFTSDGTPLADIVISLPTVDDLLSEGTESFDIDITNAGSTTGSPVVGTGLLNTMILDNDADLVTTKTLLSGDSTPDEGDTVTFEIVVTNIGAGDATNVSLIDQLPAGITLTSFTVSQGSYSAATGVWSIGSLDSLDVATLTLTGTVDVGQGGNTITNTTTAASTPDQTDPTTAGDDLTESITVDNFADLVTVKTLISGDSTPAEGDTVTYQIEVTNSGAAQATNVSLVDQLPVGLTLASSTVTQGTYDTATGLWSIGTLNNGATVTLTLSGTVDVGGGGNTITNTTTAASGDQPDPTGGTDDLSVSFTIENLADLETRKSLVSGDSTPAEGDTVTYEIVVTNNGAAQATNVSLVDQLPDGLTLAGANFPPGTTYDPATGFWNIGTLSSGATVTLTLSGTVDVGQGGNTITNTTTAASGDQPDPTAAGDDLSESFTVENLSDLVTVKTLTSGDKTPNEGDTITYQIVVTNNGAAQATNVSLTDQVPVGVTLTGSTLTQGTYDPVTGLWSIGTLSNGATATLTLTATVDVGFGGTTITNTTTEATSDQDDPTSSGDNLSVSVSAQRPELTFEKQATAVVPNGDNFDVTFELLLTNTGTVDLTGIDLVDDLATQLGPTFNGVISVTIDTSAVSAATPPTLNLAYDGAGVVSLLNSDGTLAVGDALIVNLVVSIDPDASGVSGGLSNQATASGVDPDGNEFTDASDDPDNLSSDDDPTSINIADVAVAKTVVGQPVPNGQAFDVTFELILENTGTVDLVGIDLFDDLATHFGAAFVGLVGSPALDATGVTGGTAPTLNLAFDGVSATNLLNNDGLLSAGDFLSVTFTVTIDPDASGASTSLSNQATGAGDGPGGIEVTDLSDAGNDPNSNNGSGTSDDWTPIAIPDLAVAKSVVGDPVPNGDNFDVTFDIILENTGTVDLTGVDLLDDLRAQFGPAFVGLSGTPVLDVSAVGSGLPPRLNSSFDGATDINLLNNDGVLAAGDFVVVTFTITVDPDADGSSGGLQNQAMGAADDPTGTEFTGLSDSGSDPGGDNGDGSFDDATSIVIADLGLAKSLAEQPVKLESGNFSATYQLVVSNTGTTDVANLSLVEDLQTQFGAAFYRAGGLVVVNQPTIAGSTVTLNANWDGGSVADLLDPASSSLLRVGDSFLLEFTVELHGSEIGNANLGNSVSGSGAAVDASGNSILDSNGQPIIATDVSDSGNDPSGTNSGEQGDTGGSDDATPLFLPSIGLAKRAGDAVANGEHFDVTFVLVFQNNGNVDLNDLSIVDDVESEFGNAFVSVGDAQLQNFVGSGTPPTINGSWPANTSQSIISGGQVGVGDSFEIVFTVTLDPDAAGGSLELDNRASATGAAIDSAGNPIRDSSGGQLFATDDSDNGNTADSENGEANTDGIFGNDPTPIVIADLGIAKSIAGEPAELATGSVLVTFHLVVENTGTVDLENLSLLEDLAAQFGSPFVNAGNLVLVSGPSDPGSSVSLNSAGFNGTTNIELLNQLSNNILQTGDSFEIEFDVEIDPSLVTDELENQVIGTGDAVDENGDSILLSGGAVASAFDLSDTGLSPNNSNPAALGDTGALDDPTIVPIPVSGNTGASGNPPRIPGLPPIAFVPISQFLNGPGTIYSGTTVDPLSIDSGRPVTGGYFGIDPGFGDCGWEQIDPCEQPFELDACDPCDEFVCDNPLSENPSTENGALAEAAGSERIAELSDEVKEDVGEGQEVPVEEAPQSEALEPANHAADIESEDEREAGDSSDAGHVDNNRQPFLKRFSWFSRFSSWLKTIGTA